VLSYPAAIPLSTRTLNHLAGLIRQHRGQRRSRWRRLDPGALVLRAHAPHAAGADREVEALSKRLCGYPLALTIAGSYLAVTTAPASPYRDLPQSFREYRSHLSHRWWETLSLRAYGITGELEPARLLPQIWQPSLDLIKRQGLSSAAELLGFLSAIETTETPVGALDPGILAKSSIFPDNFDENQLHQHLTALANFGLIDLVETRKSTVVRLHPLVRETISASPATRLQAREHRKNLARLLRHAEAQGDHLDDQTRDWIANFQRTVEIEQPISLRPPESSERESTISASRRKIIGWIVPTLATVAAIFGVYRPLARRNGTLPQPDPIETSTTETTTPPPTGPVLARTSDIKVGSGVIVDDYVITQPTGGTFKAFSKICTHQGCSVNSIRQGAIFCPCHGSKFSLTDGAPLDGPALKALTEQPLRRDGENLYKD
jgi:Rieske Fe-S protein